MRSDAIILVVDDHDLVRTALRDLLQLAGFDVAEASDGREGLDLLTAGLRPMAILLDLDMPVVDGRTFRSEQLKMPAASDIPVALMSRFPADAESIRAQVGAVEFWQKPVSSNRILRFARNCLIRHASSVFDRAAL